SSQTGGGASGPTKTVILKAAFPDDISQAASYLPELLDRVTVNNTAAFPGRINVNQASRTILLGIPGLHSQTVDSIIANRENEYSGQHPDRKYETWLYTEGLVKLDQMK